MKTNVKESKVASSWTELDVKRGIKSLEEDEDNVSSEVVLMSCKVIPLKESINGRGNEKRKITSIIYNYSKIYRKDLYTH